jgi:lysophospholipid acyltransferase (LPLAT)-like uncharacterized protein
MVLRRALGLLIGLVARAWLGTLRLTLLVDPALARAEARSWSLAFWHGQQFALLRWPRRRPTVALVSLSRDGELSARALRAVGLIVERGSSSQGGARGLKSIVRRLRRGLEDAAFAVDGPRGPAGVIRSDGGGVGAALAARLAGGVVVPMGSACSSRWVFTRAWDRFELPRPFSRVAVVLGAPLEPALADPEALSAAIDRARAAAVGALAAHRR